jgi:hypothetical protein
MEHEEAVRLQTTEQYLLDELSPEVREEFEEHYFDCRECAADVGAGAAFVEQSKIVFAEESEGDRVRVPAPRPAPWWAWFRPAVVAPVMAMLLAVVCYQNLVAFPRMLEAIKKPQVLPAASVNIGTFGSETAVVSSGPGDGFAVVLRIPPEDGYASYAASFYNPNQKLDEKPQWTVAIPSASPHGASSGGSAPHDQWEIRVPGAKRETGTYTVVVRGLTHSGSSEEVGRGSFEFEEQ